MNKKKLVLGSIAAAALFAPLAAGTAANAVDAGNLVINGSFEETAVPADFWLEVSPGSSEIPGWTVGGEGVDVVTVWQPDDGAKSVDLNRLAAGSISQDIATVPGQVYNVSFAMSANPQTALGPKQMDVTADNAQGATYTYNTLLKQNSFADMKYEQQTYSFTASDDSTVLTFKSLNNDVDLVGSPDGRQAWGPVVDDVVVLKAPDVVKSRVWHTWTDGPYANDGVGPYVRDNGAVNPGWHPTAGDPQSKLHKYENHLVGVPYYVPNNGPKGGGSWFLWLETTA